MSLYEYINLILLLRPLTRIQHLEGSQRSDYLLESKELWKEDNS